MFLARSSPILGAGDIFERRFDDPLEHSSAICPRARGQRAMMSLSMVDQCRDFSDAAAFVAKRDAAETPVRTIHRIFADRQRRSARTD